MAWGMFALCLHFAVQSYCSVPASPPVRAFVRSTISRKTSLASSRVPLPEHVDLDRVVAEHDLECSPRFPGGAQPAAPLKIRENQSPIGLPAEINRKASYVESTSFSMSISRLGTR